MAKKNTSTHSIATIALTVAFAAVMSKLYLVGSEQNWKFDALNAYSWLPIMTIIGLGYAALYVLYADYRPQLIKILEIIVHLHIFIFIFELWQNSASFPPISTRQYIVEIIKLSTIYVAVSLVVLHVRAAFLRSVKL